MEFWLDKCFGLSIAFPLDSLSKSWICPRETADKCGISKVDDRGTSATKRKLFSNGKCRGLPEEGQPFDLAQRASPLCCRILLAGAGVPFVGEEIGRAHV